MHTCIYHLHIHLLLLIGHMCRADHLRLYKPYRTLVLEETESPSSSHWIAPPYPYFQPFRRYVYYFHIYILLPFITSFGLKSRIVFRWLSCILSLLLFFAWVCRKKWMKLTYDYICIHICIIYVRCTYRSCMYCYTVFPETK